MQNLKVPESLEEIEVNSCRFTFDDISKVVSRFYQKVEKDALLQKPFSSVTEWPHHIERLTHFWWVRLGGKRYLDATYNPVVKHFEAGFNQVFLARWLDLFRETLQETLKPEQCEIWFFIASRMGEALSAKDHYYKQMMHSK